MGQPHKHAEVINAWADGAEIQVNLLGSWEDMGNNQHPRWNGSAYRVKPKNLTVKRHVSYVVYQDMTRTLGVAESECNIEYTFDPDGKLLDAKVLK